MGFISGGSAKARDSAATSKSLTHTELKPSSRASGIIWVQTVLQSISPVLQPI